MHLYILELEKSICIFNLTILKKYKMKSPQILFHDYISPRFGQPELLVFTSAIGIEYIAVAHTVGLFMNTEHLPKRLRELETMGCIDSIGERKCRRTGNKSIEWAVNGNMPTKFEGALSKKVVM